MRFRFRTLLIIFVLIACFLAVFSHYYQRYRAIRMVFEHGAELTYVGQVKNQEALHWSKAFWRVDAIFAQRDLTDAKLQFVLRQLPEVRKLAFRGEVPSLETAAILGRLQRLRELDFSYHRPEPEELEQICKSPSLEQIDFLAPLSDEQLEAIGKSPSLRKINVAQTNFNDHNLRYLIKTPRLEFLWIHATDIVGNVPQEAIEALLKRHPKIKLRCSGTRLASAEWWDALQKRFPESVLERW